MVLFALLVLGAGPPEVVRLRVPAEKARTWFPAGVELRGMALKEFDALVAAAKAGAERSTEPAVPRLLRARHFARWESGVLVGRSELDVDPAGRPGELALVPWTPALDGTLAPAAGVDFRVDDSGRTALGIGDPDLTTVTLRWQLRARAGSQGRGFTLGLPGAAISALELDLPEGWTPDGPAGVRRGPEPSTMPGRQTWRIEGRGGLADLRLHGAPGANETETPVWVSGPTRIDLGVTGARPNWRADWTVDADPRGPRRLDVELDPGLELIDVTGTGIDGFQAEAKEAGTRVTIGLKDGLTGPTALTIRALTRAPSEGTWAIPAARPLGALWTGGITTVRLDATRVLANCREVDGRRVLARPGEAVDGRLLAFEASAPRSVADLVFRKPWVDASVDVRGQLTLGNTEPRLQCRLAWKVYRGRLLGLDVDLPPAWVPDEVRVEGSDDPVAWHPETLPDGGVRVHAVPSSVQLARPSVVLNVSAVARIAGGRGPLSLPRVRPVGARVSDELWVARVGPGLTLRPSSARGLAWVDPKVVAPAAAEKGAATELSDGLAWRWIADDAEGRVDRERVGTDPSGTVHLQVRINPHRIRLDGRLDVDAGDDPLRTLAVGLTEPLGAVDRWHFMDEATGLEVPARPLDASLRAARGVPGAGPAWELEFPPNRRGVLGLRVHYEGTWGDQGYVPLLVLPARMPTRGSVLVLVDRVVRSSTEATGLTVLDPALAGSSRTLDAELGSEETPQPSLAYRRAHAFGYSTPAGGRLLLRTEALELLRREGVVQDAALTTFEVPGGSRRHRLALRLSADQAQALELTMPVGTELVRLRRDGQPVVATRSGAVLSVPLPVQKAQRSHCMVTLDYTEGPRVRGTLRPTMPKMGWPCVSFSWTVAAPAPWALGAVGDGLVAADPTPRRSWSGTLFGAWYVPWSGASAPKVPDEASSVLVELDKRVAALRGEEMTLGECLTRWDANRWPLVVDRMTLAASGWGPRSRVVPPGLDPSRPGVAKAALAPLGLTVVPVGVSLLITTREEAPDRPGGPLESRESRLAWERALRQASVWGSDLSDRFQSVTLWRGETTPKSVGDDEWDREPFDAGWRTWRFVAAGWPGADAVLEFSDERARAVSASALALALVGLAVAFRNRPVRGRAVAVALVLGAGLEGLAVGKGVAPLAAGAVLGGSGALLFWLGRSLPLPRVAATAGRMSRLGSTVQRRASGSAVRAFWLIAVVGAAANCALAQSGGGLRILALLPYEGAPDLAREPDRVLVRLDDYERLRSLASTRAPTPRAVTAAGAHHRVDWHAMGEALVESEYDLLVADGPSAPWRLPVDSARDLSAMLDGAPAPVAIRSAGRVGEVFVSGPGRHRLVLRRRVNVRPDERGVGFVLPINPVATARVTVTGDASVPPAEIPSARGRLETRGAGAEGLLGPADRLELHWPSPPGVEKAVPATTVEGLLLWDAEPAGDRVRARLTVRDPAGTSALRVRTEPGVSVRPAGIPGRVDVGWQGTASEPEWVASIEPPLPDGTTVVLELWRPSSVLEGATRETGQRSVPIVEPLNVRRFSGALAFRRPAEWSGRLAAGSGVEPITDEAFARQWGSLPDDALTLAGTTRFVNRPAASLRTGPVSVRLSAQPEVQLRIRPGRIDLQLTGDLVETAGRTDQLEWRVPPGLRVIAVEAEGLTDWVRSAPDRLRLRFDGAPVPSRTVRLQAWLPLAVDPLAIGPPAEEVGVPWPRWVGVEAEQGTLVIAAQTEPRIDGSGGATLVSKEQTGDAVSSNVQHRVTYRVERSEDVGRLRWEMEPPNVGVLVQSQLTVYPESAEWLAVLRYTVSGGASDVIHLNVPTAWAARAQVRLAGDGHRLTSEPRGDTTRWTIRPDHPIWGSERLVIRSSLPRPARQPLTFPDVVPLGRGTADAYLAVVNATARELATEGSAGVQPVDYVSGFRDALFARSPGGLTTAYRVRKDGWQLRVPPAAVARSADGAPAAALADLACTLAADGAVTGVATYEVGGDAGPFLAVRIPERCDVLGVTVNAAPTPLLRAPSGRWLVPVDAGGPAAVALLFGTTAAAGGQTLALPALELPGVPTLVTVRAPETALVSSPAQASEPAGPDRLALERAAWLERRTTEALDRFDRGSLREREALVSSFVAFELLLRTAERSVIWNLSGTPGDRDERLRRVQERVRAVRSSLVEKVKTAGLEEFLEEARAHAGLAAESAEEPVPELPEPSRAALVRRLGRPAGFLGDSSGLSQPGALSWSTAPMSWSDAWGGHAAAVAVPLLVLVLARPFESSAWLGLFLLILLLAGFGIAGGPCVLAAGLGLAVTGRVAGVEGRR
ncbi:MAG: hypothetical protein P4L84_22385 [Isosphaeraceae bacterium]|nr:hypothetical protein [Isosphaeraceae bacterium]